MDVDAYLQRIGYEGSRAPTLEVLHALVAAHTMAIPFENLDVLLGRPIALEPEALFQKLVVDRRGGYCFEQNGLFLDVLQALGFTATPLSGRVRLNRPREYVPPRTHLFVRVEIEGAPWLADVGVGAASLTRAIRLDVAAGAQETPHEARRIVREGDVLFHQIRYGEAWSDVYEFTGEAMPFIDRVTANWFTSTHPQSHFRDKLMVARALPDGRRVTLLDRELTVRARDGQSAKQVLASASELLEVLHASFGLSFPPATRFGIPGVVVPWPT